MKCSKCGEERREGWSFCLKCGTSFEESDQKSRIDEILSEDEDMIDEVDVPFEDMYDALSLDDDTQDMDAIIGKHLSRIDGTSGNGRQPHDADASKAIDNNTKGFKGKLKKFFKNKTNLITVIIVGIVILAAIIVLCVSCVSKSINSNAKFEQYYDLGVELTESGSMRSALTQFLKADQVAKKDEEKIKAKTMLWKTYVQLEGYEEETIQVLKELIELEPQEVAYYDALIIMYQNLNMTEEIEELIASVTDSAIKEHLNTLDTTVPASTMPAGEYDEAISVELTVVDGYTIYYTLDGSTPSESANKYKKAIKLDEEGTYELRAVSISESGVKSNEYNATYVIDFGTVAAPVVTPESGTYTGSKRIIIDKVPDGVNVYYTTDGSTPTAKSDKYIFESDDEDFEEGIEMPEGNTMFTFIAINKAGVKSDPVVVVYYYSPSYTYSYDDASDKLAAYLVDKGIMENVYGEYDDGSYMYFSYIGTEEIDKEKYYIIEAEKENSKGSVKYSDVFAVGCDNGEIGAVSKSGDAYKFDEKE
ncbi:MAG: chitobiase/beta-hexosaminidase C-terminal domain-containing protein [Eubacterium sp.]